MLCLKFNDKERLVPEATAHLLPTLEKFVRGGFEDMEFSLWGTFKETTEEIRTKSEKSYVYLSEIFGKGSNERATGKDSDRV